MSTVMKTTGIYHITSFVRDAQANVDFPVDNANKGFGGAVLFSYAPDMTMRVHEEVLGLEKAGQDGGLIRYRAEGDMGNLIDINAEPMESGIMGSGFAKDEPQDHLGETLMLPEGFEGIRAHIEQNLPPIQVRELESFQP